jgi:hypothetical protein
MPEMKSAERLSGRGIFLRLWSNSMVPPAWVLRRHCSAIAGTVVNPHLPACSGKTSASRRQRHFDQGYFIMGVVTNRINARMSPTAWRDCPLSSAFTLRSMSC